jgi:glycerophosphoryl diester phosphodiesterase
LFPQVAQCARDMNATISVDLKTTVMTEAEAAWVHAQTIEGVPFMAMARFTAETLDTALNRLTPLSPFMCETRFDRLDTIASNRSRFHAMGMALWVNTLDQPGSGEWTDSAALSDPDAIWGRLIDAGFSAIQTDEPAALRAYVQKRARSARS